MGTPKVGEAEQRLHPNQWTTEGMLRMGYQQVGKSKAFRDDVGDSTHRLDAVVATSHINTVAQDAAVATILQRDHTGIFINRHHDATPHMLSFGFMQEQLYPHAKYQEWKQDPGALHQQECEVYLHLLPW